MAPSKTHLPAQGYLHMQHSIVSAQVKHFLSELTLDSTADMVHMTHSHFSLSSTSLTLGYGSMKPLKMPHSELRAASQTSQCCQRGSHAHSSTAWRQRLRL